MNPLLQNFNTAPFSKISSDDYKPAIKKGIEIAKAEIEEIVNNSDEPTFENTTVSLDFTGEKLNRITSIFFNLNSAETTDEIQKIAQEVSPWLSEFANDITLNEALFKKVKAVFDNRNNLKLTPEQARTAVLTPFRDLEPHKDVVEGLKKIRAMGYTMITLTNSSDAGIAAQLKNANLAQYFDGSLTVQNLQIFKPDLKVYQWAQKEMNVAPEDAMLIAAHAWDIAGADKAGWKTAFILFSIDMGAFLDGLW